MKEWRLVRRAPQALGEETAVALFEFLRPLRLIHIDRFGLAGLANIVELEIGVGLHPNDAGSIRAQTRARQNVTRKIDLEITCFAAAQIAWQVERIGFRVNPTLL